MTIDEIIGEIVEKVPVGKTFDTHFVIQQLIRNDAYIQLTAKFAKGKKTTLPAHGHIGRLIASLASRERGRIQQMKCGSFSLNVHGKPSRCALWVKKK